MGPGRRVGGETIRSVDRLMLCDRDCGGGGPGGGGGSGIPGSHLDDDDPRDRDDDGVLIALAEAALLEAGGLNSTGWTGSSTDWGGVGDSVTIGMGGRCSVSRELEA
jgi:hypothetical protein